jgi:predicted deacetylase
LQVLVSLHDVTPAHLERLERAEALFTECGVGRVAYLLVPDYHGTHPIAGDDAFRQWCARARRYDIEWVLHGYYHLESTPASSHPRAWLARRTMTAGEGEFLALPADEQRNRLLRGLDASAALGFRPRAFVPPAWLANTSLHDALREAGLRYTEDHVRVFDVVTGTARTAPAISWATRTLVRRVGSRVVCPSLAWLTRNAPAIRIAVHPFDMDHPRTADQIRRTLERALRTRACGTFQTLFPAGDARTERERRTATDADRTG